MKFFLGMIAGALIALAAMLVVDESKSPGNIRTDSPVPVEAPDETNRTAVPQTSQSVPTVDSSTTKATDGTQPAQKRSASAATRDTSASPTVAVNRIELPDSHAGFVKKRTRTMADFHAEFEQEETDTAWGPVAEDLLQNYLSSVPEAQSIVVVSLHCRTTQCEVAGTVYGEDPGATWRTVRETMVEQSWYAEYFNASAREAGGNLPGEYRFLTFLPRIGTSYPAPGSE